MQDILELLKVRSQKLSTINKAPSFWQGDAGSIVFDENSIRQVLMDFPNLVMAVTSGNRIGLTVNGNMTTDSTNGAIPLVGWAFPIGPDTFGNHTFCETYGTRYAYYGGAMANGISSADMVIALGKAGFMGSFGSAGLVPSRIETAIQKIQMALPDGPYAFNLINSPNEPALEQRAAELYISHSVHVVEASAYLDLTVPLVLYRVSGLAEDSSGNVLIKNRIIAKISRKEVARRFLEPAPEDILDLLLKEKKITEVQVRLARKVPMADDITVEADSGGHTDNRPLVGLLPTMLALRDEIQAKFKYSVPVRVGAAGGISTPESTLAAFMMGADYVVTGSVNQACVESGATDHTRVLLAQADMADVIMAPSADMFEMGVKVGLLKRGTLFPLRAQKLYELYTRYNSIDDIPTGEREKQERQVFKRDFNTIWEDVVKFFTERDPHQIERAEHDPKQKMALIFRWYLGLSSRWAVAGEKGREMDYQIWCGPSMGTFNDWTRSTYLNEPENRHVVDVALHLLSGAAYLYRLKMLTLQGIQVPFNLASYLPVAPII